MKVFTKSRDVFQYLKTLSEAKRELAFKENFFPEEYKMHLFSVARDHAPSYGADLISINAELFIQSIEECGAFDHIREKGDDGYFFYKKEGKIINQKICDHYGTKLRNIAHFADGVLSELATNHDYVKAKTKLEIVARAADEFISVSDVMALIEPLPSEETDYSKSDYANLFLAQYVLRFSDDDSIFEKLIDLNIKGRAIINFDPVLTPERAEIVLRAELKKKGSISLSEKDALDISSVHAEEIAAVRKRVLMEHESSRNKPAIIKRAII